jgi:hypothetical protein
LDFAKLGFLHSRESYEIRQECESGPDGLAIVEYIGRKEVAN